MDFHYVSTHVNIKLLKFVTEYKFIYKISFATWQFDTFLIFSYFDALIVIP